MTFQCTNQSLHEPSGSDSISGALEKHEAAFLLLLGFGGLSILLALMYNTIRRIVFNDVNNLDSTFDAGGDVTTTLTAVTIASQLLWPGDLLQSTTVGILFGVAGSFLYSFGAVINISLFPLLSVQFKTRAPGAKTYLQVILARFGRPCHTIFCFFALLVNFVIMASIVVGGVSLFQATIKDVSLEFCLLMLAALCGSYSLIGGLGSTFYVSYFNAASTFIILAVIVKSVFFASDDLPFGTIEDIYEKVNCLKGPANNKDRSYFTFLSFDALLWGISAIFIGSSVTFCDQASWQSRIAAKPVQGALGFTLAIFTWFSIPTTLATVISSTYLAYTAENSSHALTQSEINSGLTVAYMAQTSLGSKGGVMLLAMFTMLAMSTGSGEIMGVSSVVVYDIYQTYLRPFRYSLSGNQCVFCGLRKRPETLDSYYRRDAAIVNIMGDKGDQCKCPSAVSCVQCEDDLRCA